MDFRRLAGRISLARTVAIGYAVMWPAAALNLTLNLLLPPGLPWSVLPIFIYTVGMSLAMPCLSIFALDPSRPSAAWPLPARPSSSPGSTAWPPR
jgi:hypothetical protein